MATLEYFIQTQTNCLEKFVIFPFLSAPDNFVVAFDHVYLGCKYEVVHMEKAFITQEQRPLKTKYAVIE